MRRVLLLSHTTGYQLRAFNDAAEALGIELAFATDRCHRLDDPWQDHAVAVRFHDLEASVRAIVRAARTRPVSGVIAVGDRPVRLAARAADALGITWHTVTGADASTDKRRSRRALAAAGLPSPAFHIVRLAPVEPEPVEPEPEPEPEPRTEPPNLRIPEPPNRFPVPRFPVPRFPVPRFPVPRFPVVLKPLGLSGSRGVIRANNEAEFASAVERIRALLARPQIRASRTGLEDEILVEGYIDGDEFALEGVMTRGRLQAFALFDKPDPLTGPYFEETIYVTPSRAGEHAQRAIVATIEAAANALGLSHGPIHAECRLTREGTVYVLEVAGRPIGGLCSRVLTFEASGARESLESVLLRHALGEPVAGVSRERAGAAVMMIPIPRRGVLKGVSGEDAARAVPGVTEIRITAKRDQVLEPLPEAGSYLGFIFARGATAADAESAVRAAHARLAFDIAREIAVGR